MVFIYILELEGGKYYIGKTSNPEFRINQHFNKDGSMWTRKYRPIRLYSLIPDCDNFDEDKYTKIYMKKFGINNVRGGSYSQIELREEVYRLLQKEFNQAEDKCFYCGLHGHTINNCKVKRLPFRNENIPSKEEFDSYVAYLERKNIKEKKQIEIHLISLQSFFSKNINNINDFFPYVKVIGESYGFKSEINNKVYGGSIIMSK